MTATAADYGFMARALHLAERGLYTTDPNPRVGCVLVKDGLIVGEGFHERAGEPHAEVNAIADAGGHASGTTAYVTLEPCSHFGRTPPCVQALIEADVARVVVAMRDPNPLVSGAGLAALEAAGVSIQSGVLEAEAAELNKGFVMRMSRQRPWVRIKLAMSLDGRTAMASGESQWITSDEARHDVQRLRARSSAVLTGSGTVRSDNPALNVRLDSTELSIDGTVRQPLRVVLDSQLGLDTSCDFFHNEGKILIFHDKNRVPPASGEGSGRFEYQGVSHTSAGLDLHAVLQVLAEREVNECHVEAGAGLGGALLRAGLADEIVIYMATHLMGSNARSLFDLPGIHQMKDRLALKLSDVRQVGPDLRLTLTPN